MTLRINRLVLLATVVALATSACGGNGAVPSNAALAGAAPAGAAPADTTSILKLLTKNVTIGSTVDAKNGDMGPRAISVVGKTGSGELKAGQVLVCNFADSSGTAGNGTTIEQFNPTASSKPTTFFQNTAIEGCDGDAITGADNDAVYATGMTSKVMVEITSKGTLKKTYRSPITQPLADGAAPPIYDYSPEYVFVGNADTGAVDNIGLGGYGNKKVIEVINGFGVNKGSGFGALGPSALSYWCDASEGSYQCGNKSDVLYVADGACNAVVEITHASSLLVKDEITVQPGCKKFTCLYPKATCAKVVKAGKPLDEPVAQTLLPNGNLIVANAGNNTLVEMTPKGKVLDTEVIDTGKAPAIFGLAAIGTNDGNTALFYTDTNTNTLQELEQ
jgi:hypothetical protein